MSDIKAKVYDRQYGGMVLECSHDRYNRLCEKCAKEAESIFNAFLNATDQDRPTHPTAFSVTPFKSSKKLKGK